ncbi:MAG TPA: hemerythrin domain-containing protein [Aquihabitans sp.]|jgi:hypothetical protein|nr:hemerythrin domain-containing protein [Aquihabitans sp.]
MTTLETTPLAISSIPTVAVDLYRDIHKAIRVDLFALTASAARTDPADCAARADLALRVRASMDFLEVHAEHEDTAIGPVLVEHLPQLAERIEVDHVAFEGRGSYLADLAQAVVEAEGADRRPLLHHLYLDLAGFTSTYLAHQDVEERELMPALEAAVGPEQVLAIHGQILASIPPDQMATSLAMMLPAMNLDDRTEMLGGMRAQAPAEVFAGVWGLAGAVLEPADHDALARRLGLS